mmetsp:Transcript_14671/g.46046  ORF Transcript_14671/g.46046 Transcript_14671/m.46046 type:complete len:107 (-) Transcript_14671:2052-2372(-)
MIPIRSERASASSMEWVVRMMQRPRLMSSRAFQRDRCVLTSSPDEGSSKKMTAGSPVKAHATDTRRRIPPDSWLIRFPLASSSSTCSNVAVTVASASRPKSPLRLA